MHYGVVNEFVSFVPDISIDCKPPYVKGQADCAWVKYRVGNRPKNKLEWENRVGMSLQTML